MYPIWHVEPTTEKRTRCNDEKKEGENKKKKERGTFNKTSPSSTSRTTELAIRT